MAWKNCFLTAVACLLVCGMAQNPQRLTADERVAPEIEGEYQYQSWNAAENKNYKGPVTVARLGDCYHVRYDNGAGMGVGIRKGNTLSVAYVYSDKPDNWGLEVFTIEKGKDGPRLVGDYTTHPGNGKLGRDVWTFVRPLK